MMKSDNFTPILSGFLLYYSQWILHVFGKHAKSSKTFFRLLTMREI